MFQKLFNRMPELVVSLFLEVGGDLIDGLDLCLESTKLPMLYPKMRVHELTDLIKRTSLGL